MDPCASPPIAGLSRPCSVASIAQSAYDEQAGIDIAGIVRLLWRFKLLVAVCTLIVGSIALALALTAVPYFRSEVVVAAVRDRGLGDAGSLAAQLGGLASLAGVNVGPGASATSQEYAAILDSNHLAEEFIRSNSLLPVLLKGSKNTPTMWRAVKAFKESVINVRRDQRRGVTVVTVEWTDATTAARWANSYVALANEIIRKRVLEEASRNIAYLSEQLAQSTDVELRKVMYDIIETETRTVMLAKGRPEYAFEVVDPAVAPDLKSRPRRSIYVLSGLVAGFGIGAALAFVLDRRRARRSARTDVSRSAV